MGSSFVALDVRVFAVSVVLLFLVGCFGNAPRPRDTPTGSSQDPSASGTNVAGAKTETWTRFSWSTTTYSRAGTLALTTSPTLVGTCTINFGFAFSLRRDGTSFVLLQTDGSGSVSGGSWRVPLESGPAFVAFGAHSGVLTGLVFSTLGQNRAAVAGLARPGANTTLYFAAMDFEPWSNPGTRGASITLRADCPEESPLRIVASNETFLLTQDSFRNGTGVFVPRYATVLTGASASAKFETPSVDIIAASPVRATAGELRISHPKGREGVDLTQILTHYVSSSAGDYSFELERVSTIGCGAPPPCSDAEEFVVIAHGAHTVTSTGQLDRIFELLSGGPY